MKKALAHFSVASSASVVSTTSVMLRTFTVRAAARARDRPGRQPRRGGDRVCRVASGSFMSASLGSPCLRPAATASRTALSWRRDTASSSSMPFKPHGPALALFGVVVLFERAHGAARHQRVAVNPQELRRVALFELAQRRVQDMAPGGRAHGDVFEFGLEIQHFRQRHALGAAAVLDQQHFRRRVLRAAAVPGPAVPPSAGPTCKRSSRTGLVR